MLTTALLGIISQAQTLTVTSAAARAWSTASNWVPANVPLANSSPTVTYNGDNEVNNVPTITLTALTINGSNTSSPALRANVTSNILTVGTLTVSKNFTANVNMTVTNGTIASSRTMTVSSGRTLRIKGTFTVTGTLANSGSIIVESGGILVFETSSNPPSNIDVEAGGEIRFQGSGSVTGLTSSDIYGKVSFRGTRYGASGFNATYQNGSTLEYNGTSAQTAYYHEMKSSGISNIIINNTSGVTFASSLPPSPTINGTLTLTNGVLTLGDNVSAGITFTGSNPIARTNGTINASGTYATLEFNNATGSFTIPNNVFNNTTITRLQVNMQATGTLTTNNQNITISQLLLSKGYLAVGAGNVTFGGTTTTFGTSTLNTTSMVTTPNAGYLCYAFPAGATSAVTFPLGETTGTTEYTPLTLGFTDNSAARTIGFRLTDGIHPNNGSSSNYISRYVTMYASNTSGTYVYNLNTSYNGASGDLVGTESTLQPAVYTASSWSLYPGLINASLDRVEYINATETTGALVNGGAYMGRFVMALTTWYLDADNDGYYAATQNAGSSPGTGWTDILPTGGPGDCNDNNAAVNPGATEICGNGIDDDCSGTSLGDNPTLTGNSNLAYECDEAIGVVSPIYSGGCSAGTLSYNDINAWTDGCNSGFTRRWSVQESPSLTFDQNITIVDTTYPIFTSLPNSASGVLTGGATTVIVNFNITGSDNCSDVTIVATPASGSAFQFGTTTVYVTITDECGNSTFADFDVVVTQVTETLYYLDADGDGYYSSTQLATSSPGIGWTAVLPSGGAGDCNDNNPAVNPGATEICGNGIDDNCNGIAEETCSVPSNNNPAPNNPGLNTASYVYPNCFVFQGTTAGSSASAQTGLQDVWYQFNAISNGISVSVTSTVFDVAVYLFESSNLNTPLKIENAMVGNGTEILNFGGLVQGNSYRIAVASANQSAGSFNICVQHLRRPTCGASGPFSLCSSYQASSNGASSILYQFTGTDNNTSTIQMTSLFSLGHPALQLKYGQTYSVNLIANYNLVNGAGSPETIQVPVTSNCTVAISQHPLMEVRSNQRCNNGATLLRSSYLQATAIGTSNVCGVTGYFVEFTPVSNCGGSNPQNLETFSKGILSSTALISLSYAFNHIPSSSNTSIGYWSVRWAPIFGSITGTYGPAQIIAVNGTALPASFSTEANHTNINGILSTNPILASIYPNPNNGEMVNLNLTKSSNEDVFVRIMDSTGRVVFTNRYIVEGTLNTIVTFSKPLASGLYMIEFTSGNEKLTQRMMVSK